MLMKPEGAMPTKVRIGSTDAGSPRSRWRRVGGHLLAVAALAAGGAMVMPGCAHDDSTLFVQTVLAPQLVSAGQTCVFTSSPAQTSLSSGILDVGLRTEYDPTYLVGNQMVSQSNSQQLQTETSIITIQGAVVIITDAAGTQLATFTRLSSATVYPASGTTPGYAPISITTVDEATAVTATAGLESGATVRLVTYVQFFGKTLGGTSVQSDNFEFPVDLCVGCLVTFSATDNNPLLAQPNCAGTGASGSTTSSLPAPCVVGQDYQVDCSQCQGAAVCEGALAGKTITDAGAGG
jgi:hypothetical protein